MQNYESPHDNVEQRRETEALHSLDEAIKKMGIAINRLPSQTEELNQAWRELMNAKADLEEHLPADR